MQLPVTFRTRKVSKTAAHWEDFWASRAAPWKLTKLSGCARSYIVGEDQMHIKGPKNISQNYISIFTWETQEVAWARKQRWSTLVANDNAANRSCSQCLPWDGYWARSLAIDRNSPINMARAEPRRKTCQKWSRIVLITVLSLKVNASGWVLPSGPDGGLSLHETMGWGAGRSRGRKWFFGSNLVEWIDIDITSTLCGTA